MSNIEISIDNNVLIISKKSSRDLDNEIERINLDYLEIGKEYKSNIRVTKAADQNKVLFFQKLDSTIEEEEIDDEDLEEEIAKKQPVIVVFSKEEKIRFMYCTLENAYRNLLKLRYKVLGISLNKRRIKVRIIAYLVNKYNIEFGEQKFYIDKELGIKCKLRQYKNIISRLKMLKDRNVYTFKFKMKDVLKDESTINGAIRFTINIDGNEIDFKVAKKDKRIKNTIYYYNPMKGVFTKKFAVHIRRGASGALMLVKRLKDPIENTLKFRFLESRFMSGSMYYIGKFLERFRKRKINVFYEKFSSKVEEGAYDLFLLFQKHKNTRNYFVIDENSSDYEKIKNNPGVVKKYSFKYYWIIYNASNWIATEAPSHLNIKRSNNGILRRAFADKRFIFLQHGVTYLKAHGRNSTFRKGKEGEVDLIVAGSEKEKDAIVDMLYINEEQVLITGLPIFSKIDYNHINQNSDDYVTIMLTWKPYEEHLYNFEESMTYQNTIAICKMLEKYISRDRIIIVAHPIAYDLLKNTHLKNSLWNEPISKALEKTKLLITDYSSVSYNSFYQGSGVIFFQPDLEKFEMDNGKLVPSDSEYVGHRVYNVEELESVIKDTIKNGKIDLDVVRTEKFKNNYKLINEFSDGKNIERIYEELVRLKYI